MRLLIVSLHTWYQQFVSYFMERNGHTGVYIPLPSSAKRGGGGRETRPRELPARSYTRACPNLPQISMLMRWQSDHKKVDAEHPHPFFFGHTPQVVVKRRDPCAPTLLCQGATVPSAPITCPNENNKERVCSGVSKTRKK